MTRERPQPACLGREDLMCSVNLEHHEQARRLCLGDARHGVPACPMLAECQQMVRDFRETQWQGGLHGTWSGTLYGRKMETAS